MLARVDELSPTAYRDREAVVRRIAPVPGLHLDGLHTISFSGDAVLVDGKPLARSFANAHRATLKILRDAVPGAGRRFATRRFRLDGARSPPRPIGKRRRRAGGVGRRRTELAPTFLCGQPTFRSSSPMTASHRTGVSLL